MESTAAEVGAAGDGVVDVTDGVGEGIVGDVPQPATNDEPTRTATAVRKKRIGLSLSPSEIDATADTANRNRYPWQP
jgi:hypothetical protein